MKKQATYFLIALAVLLGIFILSINQSLASFASSFHPGAAAYTHLLLLALELIAFVWLWRGIFGGRKHLSFPEEPSSEDRAAFTAALKTRLQYNSLLKDQDFDPKAEDYIEICLTHLQGKADSEIKNAAERIFLATALSQNGRIDALIVFLSLSRLVWRISTIYNQKPHPSEIASLYWAVVSTTFLALSFEELDISTEITASFAEIFNSITPSLMTGSVPFVGTALQTFTSSSIDGAANAFLALRAGIITRNAYSYSVTGKKRPKRTKVFREAGGILVGMANRIVDQVARSLGEGLWNITKKAPQRTAKVVVNGVSKMGKGMSDSASRVFIGAAAAVCTAGSSAGKSFDPDKKVPEGESARDLLFTEKREPGKGEKISPESPKDFKVSGESESAKSEYSFLKSTTKESAQLLKEGVKEINDFVGKALAQPSKEAGQAAMELGKAAGRGISKIAKEAVGTVGIKPAGTETVGIKPAGTGAAGAVGKGTAAEHGIRQDATGELLGRAGRFLIRPFRSSKKGKTGNTGKAGKDSKTSTTDNTNNTGKIGKAGKTGKDK